MLDMKRRDFITLLGGAVVAWPLAAHAQRSERVRRTVGSYSAGPREAARQVKPPMRQGFGTRVMERMIRGSLKGKMRFDWRAEGLACEIALSM
jgi:two-component sensor histidine kinase